MKLLYSDGATPATVLLGYGQSTGDGPMIELMPVRDPGPNPDSFARRSREFATSPCASAISTRRTGGCGTWA